MKKKTAKRKEQAMKRLKAMSNREWVQKHKPEKIGEEYDGGVSSCPRFCELEIYKKCSGYVSNDKRCTAGLDEMNEKMETAINNAEDLSEALEFPSIVIKQSRDCVFNITIRK